MKKLVSLSAMIFAVFISLPALAVENCEPELIFSTFQCESDSDDCVDGKDFSLIEMDALYYVGAFDLRVYYNKEKKVHRAIVTVGDQAEVIVETYADSSTRVFDDEFNVKSSDDALKALGAKSQGVSEALTYAQNKCRLFAE